MGGQKKRVPVTKKKATAPEQNGAALAGVQQDLQQTQALAKQLLDERDEALLEVGKLTLEKARLERVRAQLEQQLAAAINDPEGVRALIDQATVAAIAEGESSGEADTT